MKKPGAFDAVESEQLEGQCLGRPAIPVEDGLVVAFALLRVLYVTEAAVELIDCDTKRLARTVEALSGGALIQWAIHRKGTVERWVRRELETLLGPYRAPGKR